MRRAAGEALILLLLCLLLTALPAAAQETAVTDDQVNAVAQTIYCPVCPNETLDACRTEACVSWRAVIRDQLSAGQTPEEIQAYFVTLYGERVVHIPQDPVLRGLALYAPFIAAGVALVLAGLTFISWRRARRDALPVTAPPAAAPPPDDPYRQTLERDVLE